MKDDAKDFESLVQAIRFLLQSNPFKLRESGSSIRSGIENYESWGIDDYEGIKKKLIEYEQLTFKLFAIRQKLKLYGIDSSVRGWEDGILS